VDWCQAASIQHVPRVEVVVDEYHPESIQIVQKNCFKYLLAQVHLVCLWTWN